MFSVKRGEVGNLLFKILLWVAFFILAGIGVGLLIKKLVG